MVINHLFMLLPITLFIQSKTEADFRNTSVLACDFPAFFFFLMTQIGLVSLEKTFGEVWEFDHHISPTRAGRIQRLDVGHHICISYINRDIMVSQYVPDCDTDFSFFDVHFPMCSSRYKTLFLFHVTRWCNC